MVQLPSLHFSPCDVSRHVKPLQNECTLGWDNLSYTVSRRGQHSKVIINRVSGRAAPGELVAIMGPSGSGKTTLLDILADRISSGQVTGQIDLNGRPRPVKTFRLLSSYVSQEDALTGSFTVLETLRFAARLSVPANVLATEREGRVQAAIDDMGLRSCEHTVVGDIFRKGLSGGQKRRLSIAIELLSKPTILLLDEPTSGLDAASTYNVMAYIQKLCLSQKHTVICTIHQPSTKVYTMFAKVLVLAQGETVFFGSPHDLLLHFANIGYPCPTYSNPAEYYLSLVNTDFPGHGDVDALAGGFASSTFATHTKLQVTGDRSRSDFAPLSKADLREMKPSVGRQFLMVLQRTALENVRNPGIFWMRFVMFFALSAMSGTLYLNHDHQLTDVDLVSLLFGAPAFTTFLSVAALPFFLDQRAVFSRERANSGLNVGAYAVATFVAGLPGLALLAITTTVMVVPMTGLRGFGSFFGIMFASLTSAESFMCVLGVLVPNAIMGIAVGSACFGMFVLTEGFMVPKPAIQPYWLWGHYLGFHTYSFEALVANQFQGVNTPSADAVLTRFDLHDVHVGSHAGVLVGYALVLQGLGGVLLYVLHTGRR
ncbi:hypothetical protein H257_12861 [Aphanomyces astaci]|uniref:ABC transporter domain-containing protein n=1 Tax=Aphanomyces astaci TaxID=112090 RepID=W4FYL7_APHAT|nr:hypothetical protein H257_12861 [Aphanomyces astaci]ETV72071.1 hypothetical protein H257_12861 [Aphanomyces astaci]|eukprot:XP_009838514.1 hypothetical protein H257_12861 [Aphanomyces astaci]